MNGVHSPFAKDGDKGIGHLCNIATVDPQLSAAA